MDAMVSIGVDRRLEHLFPDLYQALQPSGRQSKPPGGSSFAFPWGAAEGHGGVKPGKRRIPFSASEKVHNSPLNATEGLPSCRVRMS